MKNILKHIIFPHTIATYDFFKYFRYLSRNHVHYIDSFSSAVYDSKYGCTEDYFNYQKTCPNVKSINHNDLTPSSIGENDHHNKVHALFTRSCWGQADLSDYSNPEDYDIQHIGYLRPSDTSEVITYTLYGIKVTFCLEDIRKLSTFNIYNSDTLEAIIQSGTEVVSPIKTNYPNNLGFCISEQKTILNTSLSAYDSESIIQPYIKCESTNSDLVFSTEGKSTLNEQSIKSIIFDNTEQAFYVSYDITPNYIDITFYGNITLIKSNTIYIYPVHEYLQDEYVYEPILATCSIASGKLRIDIPQGIIGISFIRIDQLTIEIDQQYEKTFNTDKGTNYIKLGYKRNESSNYYEIGDF
ncbi:MAG: hypothetical protein ACTSQY_11180 [Candidatus Odinarchaeia archaeon]